MFGQLDIIPQRMTVYSFIIMGMSGKKILFVGTKKQAKDIVTECAQKVNMPFVTERWLGGMLTNFKTVKQSTKRLREMDQMVQDGSLEKLSKKEVSRLSRERERLQFAFEPIDARPRVGRSKIRLARDGAKFFLILLKVITLFSPLRIFVPISAASLLVGVAYGAWNVAMHARIPNGSVLLILFAVVVFLVGLVSEQISSLRIERH